MLTLKRRPTLNAQNAPELLQLLSIRDSLADTYQTNGQARRLCEEAGIDMTLVLWDGRTRNTWHSIVTEALYQHRFTELLTIVQNEYPQLELINDYLTRQPSDA